MLSLQKPRTPEAWERAIAGLEDKKVELSTRLEAINQERRQHQLNAGLGDIAAQGMLAKLTRELENLKTQLEDVDGAIEQARVELEKAEFAQRKEEDRRKAEKIKQLFGKVLKKGQEIDSAFSTITSFFEEEQILLRELLQTAGISNLFVFDCDREGVVDADGVRLFAYYGLFGRRRGYNTEWGSPACALDILKEKVGSRVNEVIQALETGD